MYTSIGNRMKENYENRYRFKLTRRIPVIMRLDGKAFHTLTKQCKKPFDETFSTCMDITARKLCKEIQGVRCGYIQSDEISLLIMDDAHLNTEAWFDYNIQKLTSVAASIASVEFTTCWRYYTDKQENAIFDCRVFNIPKEEVCNYFIWRQQDWVRNSIQMLARSHFSYKELFEKKCSDIHEMLYEIGVNWATDLEGKWKNGLYCYNGEYLHVTEAPLFTQNRNIIENLLVSNEE